MFYFIRYVDNPILRIILLICLAMLLFYALGNIVQNMFNFRTNNNNFPILFGIITYLLITFVLYTPFSYLFNIEFIGLNFPKIFVYLYFIKQFIFTFVVLLFLNSLLGKWKNLNWKQINNILISIIVISFSMWLFHFLLITVDPLFGTKLIPIYSEGNNFSQSLITELNLIINMGNNNISSLTILEWIIPFITISFLYWGSKLLFINVSTLFSTLFSALITISIMTFLSFVINESLIYIIISMIYLYFAIIYLYSSEIFGENIIIAFAFLVLFSLFTITPSGITLFFLFGVPTIGYLFIRSKSTINLFLLFSTLFFIQIFLILTTLVNYPGILYGLIFLLVAIIILIPMYAVLNPTKIKDLIQLEKSIKRNALLVLYFSLGITILFAALLGLKSGDNVFSLIENKFITTNNSSLLISFSTIYSLYFIFSLYICFFKNKKANNLLLITSLIFVIGFNPLTLPLFYHIKLMNINILGIYFTILCLSLFLNLFKFLQDKLSLVFVKKQNKLLVLQKNFYHKLEGMFKTISFKQKNK